jgi:hypothetical protein
VLASQIDWRYMQRHQKERWLAIARRAFDALDVDADGVVSVDGMLDVLQVLCITQSQSRLAACNHQPSICAIEVYGICFLRH